MKFMAWLFVIVAIIFIVVYTYSYFANPSPKLDSLKTSNSCISGKELSTFGLFQQPTYEISLPKKWPFMQLKGGSAPGTFTFGINKNDPYEFLSIWSGDYNKTSQRLLLNILEPLRNYKIIKQDKIKTNSNEELKRVLIQFDVGSTNLKQEVYAYVKNNIGYVILVRLRTQDYDSFSDTLSKIICSFKTK